MKIGTTLISLDKKTSLIEYQVNEMMDQSHYEECGYCNHSKHSEL